MSATDLANRILDEEEGVTAHVIRDSRGYLTIARGCLVDPSVPCDGLCQEAIAVQSAHDLATAVASAQRLPGFQLANDVRQAVLISMVFQLGSLDESEWPDFRAACGRGDWEAAAAAGRDSKWWRRQTHLRAEREMRMIESGAWIEAEDIR